MRKVYFRFKCYNISEPYRNRRRAQDQRYKMASCFGSKTWPELQHPNRSEFSRWVSKYDPTLSRDDDCDFFNVVMILWGNEQ